MRRFKQSAALATLLVMAVVVRGQRSTRAPKTFWEPPNIDWPNAGNGKSVIRRLSVVGYPIVLDQTALQDAKQKLGGTMGSSGDAGDAEGWLCFQGSDEIGSWMFWLTSDEINGDAIGGFVWRRLDSGDSADPRCANLGGSSPIKLEFALRLGQTKNQFAKVLGKPTSASESELFYMHSHEETIRAERYTISNGIEAVTRNGVVTQIASFEISSN